MKKHSQHLNLVGTACPMNFVLIKTTLDRMAAGELLEVQLDRSPVGSDVAESLTNCGYDLVSFEEKGEFAVLLVRKRVQVARKNFPTRLRQPECGSKRRRRF
jgi:TusA-related sulfurtransferase